MRSSRSTQIILVILLIIAAVVVVMFCAFSVRLKAVPGTNANAQIAPDLVKRFQHGGSAIRGGSENMLELQRLDVVVECG